MNSLISAVGLIKKVHIFFKSSKELTLVVRSGKASLISAVGLIKKVHIFFKSSKELTLVVRSGKAKNNGYPKWQTRYVVKADHGHDFSPLAEHDKFIKFHQE